MRTQIEADLLVQTLFLIADAMGLGAWIHGAISPPVMLGDPKFIKQYGPMLGFDFVTPKWKLIDSSLADLPLPSYANARANPVGLRHKGEHLIKGSCPPYYETHVGGGRRGHRREVRAAGHLPRHGDVRADLQGRFRQGISQRGERLFVRT